jgi:hypothetical protein
MMRLRKLRHPRLAALCDRNPPAKWVARNEQTQGPRSPLIALSRPLRVVVWATAVLCGGLAFVMVVFSLVAGVDFTSAPLATLLAILFAAYFAVTLRSFARSEEIGNSRWSDRERRGF